jgi:hypothetical protein
MLYDSRVKRTYFRGTRLEYLVHLFGARDSKKFSNAEDFRVKIIPGTMAVSGEEIG